MGRQLVVTAGLDKGRVFPLADMDCLQFGHGARVAIETRLHDPHVARVHCEIQVEGDRTETRLTGPCRFVRITGSHNDVEVDIVPAGVIEITGGHNDVNWRQIQQGPRPTLTSSGESNSFHNITDGAG